ncbi:MAG: reverse transcriptase domain-containing protein [Proteobacteria bacterium]|nr:reverse transcriptase domain-containing protein [Pseudomonadota bacterium]
MQANNYWSSTSNANNPDNAWIVNMWNGNVNNNNKSNNNNYVWPVRAGEWLPPLFSFENLYRNYLTCRKHKRNTINCLKFEINAEENLLNLSEELQQGTYQPTRSVCFMVERPKMREIIAADFRDRVVHHILVERLESIFEPVFIYDSYACRKDKGLHKAVERLRGFIRQGSRNGRKRLYFMHLDIKNFFMSIDKEILYRIVEKKVGDEQMRSFAHTIIFHRPTDHCIIKGKKHLRERIPVQKSLFSAPENRGLPIGNLTSQFFANVYLNALDQFVKHTLKCRYYVRYCDDFVILHESPEFLTEAKEKISGFVSRQLNLSLNEKHGRILPVSNGIDFLGYIIREDYLLVRRRVVNNLREKLEWFQQRLISEHDGLRIIRYDYELINRLRSVIASYFGHLKWADAYRLKQTIIQRYSFLREYFHFDNDKVIPRNYAIKPTHLFSSVKSQYLHYANMFKGMFMFFQVGCFFECYSEIKAEVQNILGLRSITARTRPVTYGFPVRLEKEYAGRLLRKGLPVVIIKETGRYLGRIKERLPVAKLIPQEG